MFCVMTPRMRPAASQRASSLVAGVGLCVGEFAVHFALLPPVFVAAVGACQELVEVHRAILRPHAAGRAEIGDAALGADAGAGKDDGASRRGKPVGDLLNIGANWHRIN